MVRWWPPFGLLFLYGWEYGGEGCAYGARARIPTGSLAICTDLQGRTCWLRYGAPWSAYLYGASG